MRSNRARRWLVYPAISVAVLTLGALLAGCGV